MIDFSLQHILQNSPYDITLSEAEFIFETDYGIHYRVSFDEEEIVSHGDSPPVSSDSIRETIPTCHQHSPHLIQGHKPIPL